MNNRKVSQQSQDNETTITMTLRAPVAVVHVIEQIGNAGATALLLAQLCLNEAELAAGKDDKDCYAKLFENLFLNDLVVDVLIAHSNLESAIREQGHKVKV